MLTIIVSVLVALPVAWYIWGLSYPLAVRLVFLVALVLGMVDGQRRRRADKPQTFQDFR